MDTADRVGSWPNSVFAAFEEIGWRGYLLPHFRNGASVGAALLVGFLHGV